MNDNKQIEELAKLLKELDSNIWSSCINKDRYYAIAEHLALQNYQKIPKGSIVITKDEYQQMCLLLASACKLIGTLHKENENE